MNSWLGISAAAALLFNTLGTQNAAAQTISPPSQFGSRLTMQGDGENSAMTVHRDPLGKPCLNMEAASKAQLINPEMYEHVVSIQNRCSKNIKLKLCYFKSESCIQIEIAAQQRKDVILGKYPRMRYFRYSYQEKF